MILVGVHENLGDVICKSVIVFTQFHIYHFSPTKNHNIMRLIFY